MSNSQKNNFKQSNNSSHDIGSTLYSGTAEYGKLIAMVSAIILSIIGTILIIIGTVFLFTANTYSEDNHARVVSDSICTTSYQDNKNTCDTIVTYKKKQFKKTIETGYKKYKTGDTITVWYKKNTPEDVTISPPTKTVGIGLIIIAIILILTSWGWYWLTKKYKGAAAVGGATSIVNNIIN